VVILPQCTYINADLGIIPLFFLANRLISHAATNALTTQSFYGNLTGAFFSCHPEVYKQPKPSTTDSELLNEGMSLDPERQLPGLESKTSCSVYATVSYKIADAFRILSLIA
jgi:hypothetical protein